jgi:hypothetical protein
LAKESLLPHRLNRNPEDHHKPQEEDRMGSSLRQRMRKESLPTATSERQERQRKFPSGCDKMIFKGSNYNRVSMDVAATSPSIHSRV